MKELNDILDIIVITYNRAKYLEETFKQILDNTQSPIRDVNIIVLDNSSTDNTKDVLNKYQERFPNITYIENKFNIGGNANIVKAYSLAKKEYVWVLCDNDSYCWDDWEEVLEYMNNKKDAIFVSNAHQPAKNVACMFLQATFLPGVIYKTSLINSSVVQNMYYNISNMFPHLALCAKLINEKRDYGIVTKQIVNAEPNTDGSDNTYYARENNNALHRYMYETSWFSGYANSLQLITSQEVRDYIANNTSDIHMALSDSNSMIEWNKKYSNSFYNLMCIYQALPIKARSLFLHNYISKLTDKETKAIIIEYSDNLPKELFYHDIDKISNILSEVLPNKNLIKFYKLKNFIKRHIFSLSTIYDNSQRVIICILGIKIKFRLNNK